MLKNNSIFPHLINWISPKAIINLVLVLALSLPIQPGYSDDTLRFDIQVQRIDGRFNGFATKVVSSDGVEVEFHTLNDIPVSEIGLALGRIKAAIREFGSDQDLNQSIEVTLNVPDDIRAEVDQAVESEFPNNISLKPEEIENQTQLSPEGAAYLDDFGRATHGALNYIQEQNSVSKEGDFDENAIAPKKERLKASLVRFVVSGSAMTFGLLVTGEVPAWQAATIGYGYNGAFSGMFNWFSHHYRKINNSLKKTWQKMSFFFALEYAFYIGSFVLLNMVFGHPPDFKIIETLAELGVQIPEHMQTFASVNIGAAIASAIGTGTQGFMDFSISRVTAIRARLARTAEDLASALKFEQLSMMAASASVVGAIAMGIPEGELSTNISNGLLAIIAVFATSQYYYLRGEPLPGSLEDFMNLVAQNPPTTISGKIKAKLAQANRWFNKRVINVCASALARKGNSILNRVSPTRQLKSEN